MCFFFIGNRVLHSIAHVNVRLQLTCELYLISIPLHSTDGSHHYFWVSKILLMDHNPNYTSLIGDTRFTRFKRFTKIDLYYSEIMSDQLAKSQSPKSK